MYVGTTGSPKIQRDEEAAGVHLVYLRSYSPELSRIEPEWSSDTPPGT